MPAEVALLRDRRRGPGRRLNQPFEFEELEPRILLSAVTALAAGASAGDQPEQRIEQPVEVAPSTPAAANASGASGGENAAAQNAAANDFAHVPDSSTGSLFDAPDDPHFAPAPTIEAVAAPQQIDDVFDQPELLAGTINYGSNALTVLVGNVAPVITGVTIGGPVFEGGTVRVTGVFDDPGSGGGHNLVIDWGDGTVEALPVPEGGRRFTLTHTYANNLPGETPFPALLKLTDPAGEEVIRSVPLSVLNAPPVTGLSGPARGETGRDVSLTGTADDPADRASIEVSWDFGDGTGRPFASGNDPANLALDHRYTAPGTYLVTLIARDGEGALSQSAIPVTIFSVLRPPFIGGGGGAGGGTGFGRPPVPTAGFLESVSAHDLVTHLYVDNSTETVPLLAGRFGWGFGAPDFVGISLGPWNDSLYALVERAYAAEGGPLRIEAVSVARADGALVITLRFSRDVGGSLSEEDLHLAVNGQAVDAEVVDFSYNASQRTGTWKLPTVPTGSIHLEVPGEGVADAKGEVLDGNGDGQPGGNFVLDLPVPAEVK